MITIITTAEYDDWYLSLSRKDAAAVDWLVSLLKQSGFTLGFPYSSAIEGSRYPLRELRKKSSGHVLRVIYAFDPERRALLLTGGNKRGDKRFYERAIPEAERLWNGHISARKE